MSQLKTERVPPKASPLPPLPEDPLTPSQWRLLLALADTVIPTIIPETSANPSTELGVPANVYSQALTEVEATALQGGEEGLAKAYLSERPSQVPEFKQTVWRFVGMHMPTELRKQLSLVFNLLDYRAGAVILTGYPRSFADQPVHVRQKILQSWPGSYIPLLRMLHRSLTTLVKQNWINTSPTLNKVLSLPRVPVHGKPGKSFEYEFIQIPPSNGDEPEVIETDVVIVGSGCGGSVCARNLAEAGLRVIVAEKSYHWPAEHLPMTASDGGNHLFMHGGAIFSDDSSSLVLAGQAWGGGGTVNWSASLQTQGFVRKEWSETGLPFFTSAEFQTCLDRVCERMGVGTDAIKHNPSNSKLLEGARKLGWSHKVVPQNTAGNQHYCGYCTLGCGACEKQGPVVSYLPLAAKAGAKFIEGFDCEKILFDVDKRTGKKVATGIIGLWKSRDEQAGVAGPPLVKRKVIIKAKRVIISAGTMQSPLVLKRSGLKNPHIGKHLKIHPVLFMGAIYDEEIRPWEGGILTSVVTEFDNQDGHGHGVKLEATSMLPHIYLTGLPWTGGLDFKLLAPKLKHMVGHFSIARDTGEGEVYADPVDGRVRFKYHPTKVDKNYLLEGIIACAKINLVEGAREIFTHIPGTSTYSRSSDNSPPPDNGVNSPAFQTWVSSIRKRGTPSPDVYFGSAHQMGTCRMAKSAKEGVVDQMGKVYEVEGVYVSDASIFPSASGVNPMVTNMAISEWISTSLAKELKGEGVGVGLKAERAKL